MRFAALALLLLGGCTCKPKDPVRDAGTARIHRSTDLKTAVFTMYPEFRGARVMAGGAVLTRTMNGPVPLDAPLLETVTKNGFALGGDGGMLLATRAPYTLRVEGPVLAVSLPIVEADIGKLLNAPLSMTSEQIALWFPKPTGVALASEEFRVKLIYDSIAWRTSFLVWQMVTLNAQGTWRVTQYPDGWEKNWRPDGGGGAIPGAFSMSLVDQSTTARIDVVRDGGFVQVEYVLATEEPVRNP